MGEISLEFLLQLLVAFCVGYLVSLLEKKKDERELDIAEQLEKQIKVLKSEINVARMRIDNNENIMEIGLDKTLLAHERIDTLANELKRLRGDKK